MDKRIKNLKGKRIDITGERYGRWIVIRFDSIRSGKAYWQVKCDCGNEKVLYVDNLKRGQTRSCGCLRNERIGKLNYKHGMAGVAVYKSWQHMKDRCLNSNNKNYKYYGGRGIKVCDQWINSFENFYEDTGERPKGMTLERIDNNKGYEPSNCKWATAIEQQNNMRSNHIITYKGLSLSITQWERNLNMNVNTLYIRIYRGWTVKRAIETSVGSYYYSK